MDGNPRELASLSIHQLRRRTGRLGIERRSDSAISRAQLSQRAAVARSFADRTGDADAPRASEDEFPHSAEHSAAGTEANAGRLQDSIVRSEHEEPLLLLQ